MRFLSFILLLFVSISCNSKNSIYLSGYHDKETTRRIEQALRELHYKELSSKKVIKKLSTIQKKVRTQAEKNIRNPEKKQDWKFFVHPDSIISILSFIPPDFIILSEKLVHVASADSIDISPLFYHYLAHYEIGDLRKRSEATLVSQFGGTNLSQVALKQPFEFVQIMQLRNGAPSRVKPVYPFNISEEERAEWLAAKAFANGRKDSLTLSEIWKTIHPDSTWAADFLQIHTSKIKMAN